MPVDALVPTWINAPDDVSGPAYDAETLRRDFAGLVAAGASASVARSGVLDPRALVPSLSGSNIQVSAGPCVVGTAKGAYFSGAPTVLTVAALGSAEWPAADSTNPRRDRLVFEVLDPDNGGSTARKARFRVIAGQPSATALSGGGYPADPGSADGVSAFFNIADIDVPKNGGGNPTITDRRPYTAAAGGIIHVRDAADLANVAKVQGRVVSRLDQGGALVRCNGTDWVRLDARTNLDIALTQSSASTPNALWGPGSAAQMSSAVTSKSNNRDRFAFPTNNQVQALDEGLYDATWTIRFFGTDGVTPKATTGFLRISDEGAGVNQVHHGVTNFSAVGDVSVSANNISLAALEKLNLNFQVPDSVTAKHWIRLAKKG